MNIYLRKVASEGINHHVEHCIFVPASRVLFSSRCPTFRVSLLSSKDTMAASVLALPSRLWEPAHWLSHSTMMAASVLAHTHFNYDGSQRAGFAIWTMAASVLAYPLQL